MKPELSKLCVKVTDPISAGLAVLNSGSEGICLVIDENGKMLGTVTDGDCRRALLSGQSLNSPIRNAMHTGFIAVDSSFSLEQVHALMRTNAVKQIPVVDDQRHLIDLILTRAALRLDQNAQVLVLAGGKGTRLRPLTENVPKPMLPVNGRPMLANLIDSLVHHNFCDIYIATSYLADQIENYFQDGSNWGCSISYVREDRELGTAGPLSLMPLQADKPILVVNGDLVTKVNFSSMFEFHKNSSFDFTVGSSNYNVEVPFGVLEVNAEGNLKRVSEKPVMSFPINAGIYVLNPEIAGLVPLSSHFTMTDLITKAISSGLSVGAFPIHERWLDVGLPEQYKIAQKEV